MPNIKSTIIYFASAAVLLSAGFWAGKAYSDKEHLEYFYRIKDVDVQQQIKVLDNLYANDSQGAIQRVELWLDRDVLVIAPNEYQPSQNKEGERAILQMIATHRKAHPFSRPNSPGTEAMVKKALQSAE